MRRARGRGETGAGEGLRTRTRPQNGHTRPPVAAKREHSSLFLGDSNLQPPLEFPSNFLPLSPPLAEQLSAPCPSVSFEGGGGIFHGRRRACRRRPSRLGDSLPSFPFLLTQYTEMREAVVGFHFFFVVVCMQWGCESAGVSGGQCGLLPSAVFLAIGCWVRVGWCLRCLGVWIRILRGRPSRCM